MKLTLDSAEPLEDAMRVLSALYDVKLVIADDDQPTRPHEPSAPAPEAPKTGTQGRRRSAAAKSQRARVRSMASPSNQELRSWARENGHDVRDRGRVPASVVAAYHDARGQ